MSNQLKFMGTLSIRLNLMPGIVHDIDLKLEDLLESFNNAWSLEERLELIMGLELDTKNRLESTKAITKVFSDLDVNNLTVGQLMILDSVAKDFRNKINVKKEELLKIMNK